MPSATTNERFSLSEEQKQHFLEHGFIKVENCFSREAAQEFCSSIWTRIGASPVDKSTWPKEKVNLPGHTMVDVREFAPKAYDAIAELIGGEDRMADWTKSWKDGWIINLGKPEYKPTDPLDVRTLDNWHNDGDWFVHFLDSGEQALLVIPLFSDIEPKGGGTVICTDGIGLVAKHMYNHPGGTTPFLAPWGTLDIQGPERRKLWESWVQNPKMTRDESFHEATGKVGDVYLLHPLMLHSASRNLLRNVRIIINPPVALKEPFNFNRDNPKDYSLVEMKTLRDLGRPEGIPEWKITASRQMIKTPPRVKRQEEMKRQEVERLEKAGIPITTLEGAKPLHSQTDYPS